MSSAEAPLGSRAYVGAGLFLALIRLAAWATLEEGPFLAGLADAGFVLVSALFVAICDATATLLARPKLSWVAFLVLLVGVGARFLQDDLGGLARRQEWVSEHVFFYSVVLGVACTVCCATWVVLRVKHLALRGAVTGLAAALLLGNGLVLLNDYWGIHLFAALAALIAAGAVWVSYVPPFRAPSFRAVGGGMIALAAGLVLAPIPATADAALSNSVGAPLAHAFRRLIPQNAISSEGQVDGEWYQSRAEVPDIPPNPERPFSEAPFVVVVTVDALRADVVNSGEHDDLLPTLARLRDEGVCFTEARAPGTLTKVSLASTFTGIYFSQQYWSPMKKNKKVIGVQADKTKRFAEMITDSGARTANFRSVPWVRNGNILGGFAKDKKISAKGSGSYYAPAKLVFRKLMPYLRRAARDDPPRSAFVYTHLTDPHAPYNLGRVKKGKAFKRYLSEVEVVDKYLSKIIKVMSQKGVRQRALLIISADHGEAFGEHKSTTHGTTMYDEALRVPFLFWRPTGSEPRKVDDLVSLMDLGPTMLDIFGVPTPGTFMGQSLLPYLMGETPRLTRPILAETRLMRSLVTHDRIKLIHDVRSGRKELYDLKNDPLELNNLADDERLMREPWAQMSTFFEVHTLRRDGYTPPFVK